MWNDTSFDENFRCPIAHETMADPVIAADGHTYERAAIERWLAQKQTSPITNQRLPHKNLLPNYSMKAMIASQRDEQEGDAGKQNRVRVHLLQIGYASSSAEACRAIKLLGAFVEREAIVVEAEWLLKTRKCLQTDEEAWRDGTEQALDALAGQCRAVVSSKAAQLRKARAAAQCAEETASVMESNVVRLQGELELAQAERCAMEAKGRLEAARKASGEMRRVAKQYRDETAGLEKALGGCGGEAEEEEEMMGGEDAQRGCSGKRTRGPGVDASAGGGAKRRRVDGRSLFEEANALVGDEARRRVLTRMAADCGWRCAWAVCLTRGWGEKKEDAEEGVELLKAVAHEEQCAEAKYNLGFCYTAGAGVARDTSKAAMWYTESAEQGNAMAQSNLGICYEYGEGVAKDRSEAVKWYTEAAEQGNAMAQSNLGLCYATGAGVALDMSKALEWLTKAAEQGNVMAQSNLGRCYANGIGVAPDTRKALELFTKAAEHGIATAQNNLGVCYANGIGVARDRSKAVEWYTEAAEQGCAEAQNNLRILGACAK